MEIFQTECVYVTIAIILSAAIRLIYSWVRRRIMSLIETQKDGVVRLVAKEAIMEVRN